MRTTGSAHNHRGVALVMDHVDGRSRSAVAAVRALAAGGYRPLVTVAGGPSAAGASRSAAGVLRVPAVDSPDFRGAVEDHLAAHPGSTALATSDPVLVALDLPGAHLVDKAVLPKLAATAGLRVPPTRTFASAVELLEEADRLDYPVVVKPVVKSRPGEDARRVDSAVDLLGAVEPASGPVVVQPFSTGAMRAVAGVIADGELRAVVHQRYLRIWPVDCGTASAAVTTEPDRDLEARLPQLLDGHTGIFQVQLVGDQVIDINPRAYGSLPLAVAAGANLPAIACAVAAGDAGTDLVRGRPGVRYRWLEGDVRRVIADVRRGSLGVREAGLALRPHRGTAHSVESLRDPGPSLVRMLDVARRLLS